MLDRKLQLRPGARVALVGATDPVDIDAPRVEPDAADAILWFVVTAADLADALDGLARATAGRMLWVAYPKAKQRGTVLNRDRIRSAASARGLDPVRQIAVDDVWSALRLKPSA